MKLVTAEIMISRQYRQREETECIVANYLQALESDAAQTETSLRPYVIENTFSAREGRAEKRLTQRLAQFTNMLKEENIPYYVSSLLDPYDDGQFRPGDQFVTMYRPTADPQRAWTIFVSWHEENVFEYANKASFLSQNDTSGYCTYSDTEEIKRAFLDYVNAIGEKATNAAIINTLLGG